MDATLATEKAPAPAASGIIIPLDADKPKIAFHAAMMAIQNFGFFIMYWDIWGATPSSAYQDGVCDETRYATGMMALTCFCVAFLCVGMGLGGATSDYYTFLVMWYLHLVGGSMYTACTVIVPAARYSKDGEDCAKLSPVNGDRLDAVYTLHAILYLFYVGGMLSITYFAFLKRKIAERKLPLIWVIAVTGIIFIIPQAIVYSVVF